MYKKRIIMAYIEFENVKKEYQTGDVKVTAVEHCSFAIEKGELAVILGPSGAGKTTVLNLLGGMDRLSDGKIYVNGARIDQFRERELIAYRRNEIGFVFQFYNLVPNLTAIENVELACQICKNAFEPQKILTQVGLKERMKNFPAQLSGGEQQRVAIARAIAKNPKLLLCDEPTGALDSHTGRRIIALLQRTCHEMGMTTIIITHNAVISQIADKVIHMKNGTVQQIIQQTPKTVEEIVW